jgi:hypothetical protein
MERPATWKILTLGAALIGLGVAGAGPALADNGASPTGVQPIRVSAAPAPVPLDPPWWDDDMIDWIDKLPIPQPRLDHVPDGPFWDDDWFDG